jgi:hypothetical protein
VKKFSIFFSWEFSLKFITGREATSFVDEEIKAAQPENGKLRNHDSDHKFFRGTL